MHAPLTSLLQCQSTCPNKFPQVQKYQFQQVFSSAKVPVPTQQVFSSAKVSVPTRVSLEIQLKCKSTSPNISSQVQKYLYQSISPTSFYKSNSASPNKSSNTKVSQYQSNKFLQAQQYQSQ